MDENNTSIEALDVQGFRFLTKADADKAYVDAEKIKRIEQSVGIATSSALMAIYEKSIQNKIFGTPVGWSYLQDIRKRLEKMGVGSDELTAIPMTVSFTRDPNDMLAAEPAKQEQKPKKEKRRRADDDAPKPPMLILSFVMNLILVVLVIVMFVIINFGETDNMINYKQNITNRYASWEQELTEREQAVRAKERELGIDNSGVQSND